MNRISAGIESPAIGRDGAPWEAADIHGHRFAAIVHADSGAADEVLARFATVLHGQGRRVRGLVRRQRGGTGKEAAFLVDIDRGDAYPLFQNLGSASVGCSIDPTSIAAASAVLRRALGDRPELVVVNRFGSLEASGRGFAAEMLAVMSEGIALLTVVSDAHLSQWCRFCGGFGIELEPTMEALCAWFDSRPAGT